MQTLKQRRDFLKVSASSFKYIAPGFILQALPHRGSPSRFGLTASKKVGGAVDRNFAKRRIRVLVQRYLRSQPLSETYYVIVARPAILKLKFADLEADFQKALQFIEKRVKKSDSTEE
ncbi:Ribonuclease P protein component [Candidatus Bealeia paramacronuclearis]|uniref:Ribonuclease P protein component n=1 Tax=Candidatus Bealeia paramacronuclearis TaxID=1921001 RepID=A0ABZ2C4F3_9PROT|nr:Ribonuclease P protein component [Candidatus Bealeia paramacronuclearis]